MAAPLFAVEVLVDVDQPPTLITVNSLSITGAVRRQVEQDLNLSGDAGSGKNCEGTSSTKNTEKELTEFVRQSLDGNVLAVQALTCPQRVVFGHEKLEAVRQAIRTALHTSDADDAQAVAPDDNNTTLLDGLHVGPHGLGVRGKHYCNRLVGIAQGTLQGKHRFSTVEHSRVSVVQGKLLLEKIRHSVTDLVRGLMKDNAADANAQVNQICDSLTQRFEEANATTAAADLSVRTNRHGYMKTSTKASATKEFAQLRSIITQAVKQSAPKGNIPAITKEMVGHMDDFILSMRENDFSDYNEGKADVSSTLPSEDVVELCHKLDMPIPMGSIVMLAEMGSKSYNLNVAHSDVDYKVLFLQETKALLSFSSQPIKSIKHVVHGAFGIDKGGEVEYDGTDLIQFVAEVCKGSVPAFECLWGAKPLFNSVPFDQIQGMRDALISEYTLNHYFGFLQSRLQKIDEILKKDSTVAANGEQLAFRKLLYQLAHKVGDLKRMVHYQKPLVWLEGEERDRIRDIRMSERTSVTQLLEVLEGLRALVSELSVQRVAVREQRIKSQQHVYPLHPEMDVLVDWAVQMRLQFGWRAPLDFAAADGGGVDGADVVNLEGSMASVGMAPNRYDDD